MRYLIFVNTPAHVHLYRNLVEKLEERGHEVLLLGRDYACTEQLLQYYELPYELYGVQKTSTRSLVTNVPKQFGNITRLVHSYGPEIIFGRGAYAAFAGAITRTPVVLVLDSEPSHLMHRCSSWFADTVLTPDAFDGNLGTHHYRFQGLKECAYLHPDVYRPDASVRDALGVGADEPYALVRFNAFDALHDVGTSGSDVQQRRKLLTRLAEHLTVFVSDEGGTLDISSLPVSQYDIHPGQMHDALAEARLFVTDTGTMATEAALLGTPTIRLVDESEPTMGEFTELEHNDLLEQLTTVSAVIETGEELLNDTTADRRWNEKRRKYLSKTVNLTDLLLDVAEQTDSIEELSANSPGIHPA